MHKFFIVVAGLSGFLVVALGAFGAHGLRNHLGEELMKIFQTGIQYHMLHTVALLAVGILAHWLPNSALLKWSGGLFITGMIIFSGSLYILSVSGVRAWGAVTPLGGLAFLGGWIMLAVTAWKHL